MIGWCIQNEGSRKLDQGEIIRFHFFIYFHYIYPFHSNLSGIGISLDRRHYIPMRSKIQRKFNTENWVVVQVSPRAQKNDTAFQYCCNEIDYIDRIYEEGPMELKSLRHSPVLKCISIDNDCLHQGRKLPHCHRDDKLFPNWVGRDIVFDGLSVPSLDDVNK